MPRQTINTGVIANDGSGDTLRTAFTKTNQNFIEVYSNDSNTSLKLNTAYVVANAAFEAANNFFAVGMPISSKGNQGDVIGMLAANDSYLAFCTETYEGNNRDIWKRIAWSQEIW